MAGTCDMPYGPLQGRYDLPKGFRGEGTLMRPEFLSERPERPGEWQYGRMSLEELVEWGGSQVGEMGRKLW